jgi:ribosome recycling factor
LDAIKKLEKETHEKMSKAIEVARKEFAGIRTGKASPALLDPILVDYYGSQMKINQIASISVPEAKLIVIQPWDKSVLDSIQKAIQKSDLGLNPTNDGKLIRIAIPALTEERRKDLVKLVKKKAEEARVTIRNIRRNANDQIKELEKEGAITEDEKIKSLDKFQKITDDYINKINEIAEQKEKEIMES